MDRVLWMQGHREFSEIENRKLGLYLKGARISRTGVFFGTIHKRVPGVWVKKGKTKWMVDPDKASAVRQCIRGYIMQLNPKVIVLNDTATLHYIAGKPYSLEVARGSIFYFDGVPCLVIDDLRKTIPYKQQKDKEDKLAKFIKYGGWVLQNDLQKLARWMNGTQRYQPKFTYKVIITFQDLVEAEEFLCAAAFQAHDIETKWKMIASIAVAGLSHSGEMRTYVFPFVHPLRPGGAYWESPEAEILVWQTFRKICASPAYKIFQNGAAYDCSYYIRYRLPIVNYILDTTHLWHSIFAEAPKKLNFITSVLLDYMRYWKDELKGEKEDSFGRTEAHMERYWRYNALDSYYTLLDCRFVVMLLMQNAWTQTNYLREFALQIGPTLDMNSTGMRVDLQRQKLKTANWQAIADKELAKLRKMVADEEFNPNSPQQVAYIIYDILGAEPIKVRGKKNAERSTDEKMLKLIAERHWLFKVFIEQIWKVKKPLNNITKYGTFRRTEDGKWKGLQLFNRRWLYTLNAAGTETGRFNSHGHAFWVGTANQNVPAVDRDMAVADEGYAFFEADYAQSDAWYIAFESEDPEMMRVMQDLTLDKHCFHAAHFFRRDYDSIRTGYLADEPWVTHPTKGLRNITKRIVHGSNFQMAGFTLFVLMGRTACIAAAESLGATLRTLDCGPAIAAITYIRIPGLVELPRAIAAGSIKGYVDVKPTSWNVKQLADFCQLMLDSYHILYKRLRPWFTESINAAVKNGNRVTCAHGFTRMFFGDIANDKNIQREISAFFGQGGTAGNINRSLVNLYYQARESEREIDDRRTRLKQLGGMFITQTHDSILFQLPIEKLHQCAKLILTTMEEKFTIRGRELSVPTDAKVGLSWGKGMIGYRGDLTIHDLEAAEEKMHDKYRVLEDKLMAEGRI